MDLISFCVYPDRLMTDESAAPLVTSLGTVIGKLEGIAKATAPSKQRAGLRGRDPNIQNPARPYSRPWSKAVPKPARKPAVSANGTWAAPPIKKTKKKPASSTARLPPGMGMSMHTLGGNKLDGLILDTKRRMRDSDRPIPRQAKSRTSPVKPPRALAPPVKRRQPVPALDPFDFSSSAPRSPPDLDDKTVAAYTAAAVVPPTPRQLPPMPSKSRTKNLNRTSSKFKMQVPGDLYN